MHMLADATEVGIVVLGDQGDAQRLLVLGGLEQRQIRQRRMTTTKTPATESRIQERHGRRPDVRLERGRGSTTRSPDRSNGRISRIVAHLRVRRRSLL